ncbi:MAG: TIGR03960 family B12-binding radical SAM protein [Candidatus Omnitrophota bacterium]
MIKDQNFNTPVELDEILLNVRKPARYIGQEYNAVYKKLSYKNINFALCFPDSYEIGMSHLGLKILYNILNKQEDVYAQRCFSPWPDMQLQMQKQNIKLFSLETQTPLNYFDIIGFSLQYELGFTNVLGMLDLAGMALHSEQRKTGPLVIAGGPCCLNPEPMYKFIDAFFIGESEELILEFLNVYRQFKKKFLNFDKNNQDELTALKIELLERIARIEGIYVPRFYTQDFNHSLDLIPQKSYLPKKIKRRFVSDLNNAEYFEAPCVPYVDIVHDRISLEIMRGCPNRCYFCQAGFTINPLRMRSVENLISMARKIYANTGYDNISFCSLSSANYPQLKKLILKVHDFFKEKGLGISLPSLRVDKEFLSVISLISDLKKTGLTFAPEAGSGRLRKLINKNLDMEKLSETILTAYQTGWRRLKLYFMIGLPTETETDLLGIVQMINEYSELKKQVDGRPARVSVGISNFIPKAHTPFQWLGMERRDQLGVKQKFLRDRLLKRILDVDFHDIDMSFIEACLARGDRSMAAVIEKAYFLGARFDAWTNFFNYNIWQEAFEKTGLKAEHYVNEGYALDCVLPWDHIDCLIKKNELKQYYTNISTV